MDLAVLTDYGAVTVLGEAKRAAGMLDLLLQAVRQRFGHIQPGEQTKQRGDEARQLAWRLWLTRPSFLWLIGPGVRHAYRCTVDNQLQLEPIPSLPSAGELGLAHRPATKLPPPTLR